MRSAWKSEASQPKKRIFVPSDFGEVIQHVPDALRAFDQSDRQDELHLKVSLVTGNRFMIQLLEEAKVKQVLWNIERLIAASQNKPYQRLETRHGFKILSAVPIQEIVKSNTAALPEEDRNRLRNFLKLRWPQIQGQEIG